uniref:Uncharacterized protein n=1 Tax=Glossina pallidipes TaxID=7398 RepID=A0A1A9ZJR9_GLOPL
MNGSKDIGTCNEVMNCFPCCFYIVKSLETMTMQSQTLRKYENQNTEILCSGDLDDVDGCLIGNSLGGICDNLCRGDHFDASFCLIQHSVCVDVSARRSIRLIHPTHCLIDCVLVNLRTIHPSFCSGDHDDVDDCPIGNSLGGICDNHCRGTLTSPNVPLNIFIPPEFTTCSRNLSWYRFQLPIRRYDHHIILNSELRFSRIQNLPHDPAMARTRSKALWQMINEYRNIEHPPTRDLFSTNHFGTNPIHNINITLCSLGMNW